tara:strand:- start:2131 stop:2487 length:357 start_codon:yes stop_codon:yes gene_type:complete
MRKKALEEDGCEIGAGMPDHPLRVPEATMTDRVEEIEARHKAVDGDLDISPMDDCELADHEDRAFLLSTIRALQADLQSVRRLTIKYHGLGMKDPAQWRVGLEEIASVVAEDQSHDQS